VSQVDNKEYISVQISLFSWHLVSAYYLSVLLSNLLGQNSIPPNQVSFSHWPQGTEAVIASHNRKETLIAW